ncbi:uncharacterized protein BcabD6B2_16120 [Babesia caballi]|uniref:Uncharacterized protein n=1 Tax=Babesia caballi TaxID=5871 RepID=A0AAV4LQV4_BABCB|nr:hypothetical protein, conserved [Babesia caballi]
MDGGSPNYTSLTDSPQNLKESIDWMLRISGKDGAGGGSWGMSELPNLIFTLFKQPDRDLTAAVKKSFKDAVEKVAKDLENKLQVTNGTFSTHFKKFSEVETVRSNIDVNSDVWLDKFKDWIAKGCTTIAEADGPLIEFAEGLEVFMGYKNGELNDEGLGKKGQYKSAYNGEATWGKIKDDNGKKKQCALIFLDVVITCFSLLTYLYWNGWRKIGDCGPDKDGDWANLRLCDPASALCKFLETAGFNDFKQIHTVYTKMNKALKSTLAGTSMKGSTLSGRLQTAFPEFGRAMSEKKPTDYFDFVEALTMQAQCDDIFKNLGNNRGCTHTGDSTCDSRRFAFTKLFIVCTAYKTAVVSTSPNTVIFASAAAVAGAGVSAYLAHLLGLLPALGIF